MYIDSGLNTFNMYPKLQEIERKFIVSTRHSVQLRKKAERIVSYTQGYFTACINCQRKIWVQDNKLYISFFDAENVFQQFVYELEPDTTQVLKEKLVDEYGCITKIRIRISIDLKQRPNVPHRIKAYITIKGSKKNFGMIRPEVEFLIPMPEAEKLLNVCDKLLISKTRLEISFKGNKWDVDIFHAENEGLIVAEIELDYINQSFNKPNWCGREVTDDNKYYNGSLRKKPFSSWKKPTTKKGKQKKQLPLVINQN